MPKTVNHESSDVRGGVLSVIIGQCVKRLLSKTKDQIVAKIPLRGRPGVNSRVLSIGNTQCVGVYNQHHLLHY